MASRGDKVALSLTAPADAENHHEFATRQILDVVDLLPGPIWHIIFRHLLAHHSPENRGDTSGASQQGARSTSNAKILPFPASTEQHAEALRSFGPSWPLLYYAMASKRLLHHVATFAELEPMTLVFNTGMVSFFLRHAAHTSLDLVLNSTQDLDIIARLLQPSARSLTSLGLGIKEPPGGIEPIIKERHLMNPAFLEEFQQLQRLKLGRGTWQLGNLDPGNFKALRSLSIHDFDCDGNSLTFLSSIAPQLHELALACSSHGSGSTTLDFKFPAARAITVCFEKQALHLRLTMAPSLKSFSATAAFLNVDCTCGSRLSLDSLSLIGRSQLLVTSLPLASAKSVYVNGPTIREYRWRAFPCSDLESQRTVTHLLSSIAPTVESLIVRNDWPLQGVRVEWSRLRRLAVGMNRYSTGGVGYKAKPEDPEDSNFWRCFGGEEESSRGGSSSSSSSSSLFISAPNLKSFFYHAKEYECEPARLRVALRRQLPSLALFSSGADQALRL